MPLRPDIARFWPALAASLLLSACTLFNPAPPPAPAPAPPPAPAPVPPPPPPPPPPQVDPADQAARRLLAYHEQLRQWSPAELGQEITRLNAFVAANASSASPQMVLELSLALSQTRSNGDLARAVVLLDPLVKATAPELQPWQPLARLLQARFAEQRRVEEQLDRQGAQLRDAQRNLQQTNDKLEALKAIERSLTARPAIVPAPVPKATPAPGAPKAP
ncbi:MAG: hypothetical protein RLZZ618_2868 [Pseudomonadota bacterium]|jgi:hypothetical protein